MWHKSIPEGVGTTVNYVLSAVRSGEFPPGTILPTVKSLSSKAGVSPSTFLKGAHVLKERGVLEGMRGRRFSVHPRARENMKKAFPPEMTDLPANDIPPVSTGPCRKRLARHIKNEIVEGIFPPGTFLPSMKELCSRYTVSFRPLKDALAGLVAQRILVPRGRRYAVPRVASKTTKTTIVCMCFASTDRNRPVLGTIDEEFIHALEKECFHAKVSLEIVLVCRSPQNQQFIHFESGRAWHLEEEGARAGGFVFLVNVERFFDMHILRRVHHHYRRKPIAVFDEIGIPLLRETAQTNRFLRIFTISSGMTPGRIVARFLMLSGHRKAAYFSPFHKAEWSRKRYQGLSRHFAQAHPGLALRCYSIDTAESIEDYGAMATSRPPVKDLFDWYDGFSARLRKDEWGYGLSYELYSAIHNGCRRAEVNARMKTHFTHALRDSAITVWVLVNDATAVHALEFLSEKRIRVPRDISLLSFDNTSSALRNGLSSYDFRVDSAARNIMHFLLYPHDFSCRHARAVIETEGMIIERNTTARLRA